MKNKDNQKQWAELHDIMEAINFGFQAVDHEFGVPGEPVPN